MAVNEATETWRPGVASRDPAPRFPVAARARPPSPPLDAARIARGLAWFSISLGVLEVIAPRFVSRVVGGRGDNTTLIRLFGIREIASGAMIFGQGSKPAAALWSRVVGDAIDIAALVAAAPSSRNKGALAVATANVLGVTALDVYCARELGGDRPPAPTGKIHMARSVVINRAPDELYRFWHDFENFPRFMYHLESVRSNGARASHWVARGPAGTRVEWDAEITADTPNELIAWRSLPGADVENSGIVQFEARPGGRGTIVRVEIEYRPPLGVAGSVVAKLFNASPEQQIYDDLHRMQQVIETGEVVRSDGSPEGMGTVLQSKGQPAATMPSI